MKIETPSGLWAANDEMEAAARLALRAVLSDFDTCIADVYEAGVQVPTLPGKRHQAPELVASALFLKRTLVELRATWQLTSCGYTTSAASVAASLFEHALAAEVLASEPSRAEELKATGHGDLPWSPRQLARIAAEHATSRDHEGQEVAKVRARNIYAAYKWLCKVKHPTLRATAYGAGATEAEDGSFVVMAAPDLRLGDLVVKRMLLVIALGRTVQALKAFAAASAPEPAATSTKDFRIRLDRGEEVLLEIARREHADRLPFLLTREEGQAL